MHAEISPKRTPAYLATELVFYLCMTVIRAVPALESASPILFGLYVEQRLICGVDAGLRSAVKHGSLTRQPYY